MNRYIKILGISVTSALFIIVLFLFLIKVYSPAYLIPYIVNKVENETNGRYMLSVSSDSLHIKFVTMSFSLGQTEFKRDTSVNEYSGIPFLDKFDVKATFQSFDITALNVIRFTLTNDIRVGEISLKKPSIVIRKNRNYKASKLMPEAQTEDTAGDTNLHLSEGVLADTIAWGDFKESGSAILPHLVVNKFKIEDAHFSFYGGRVSYPIHEVNGLTFDVSGFQLLDQKEIEVEDVFITIDSASSLLNKNTSRLTLQGVKLHPKAFHVDSLHFKHIVDKYAINRIKGFRASWLNIGVGGIDIDGLHPGKLINDSLVIVDKVTIDDVYFNLFKDKSEPVINPTYKPLPQEIIRNIHTGLKIDTLELLNADLLIEMQAPKADVPGQIVLNRTKALITNITNIPEFVEKNQHMGVNLSSYIINKIPLTLDYTLDMKSEVDQFWAKCKVAPFDASILNDFLGSQFFIEFKSGQIDNFEFDFEGNNKVNVGEMDFEYTKLRMQKLQGYEYYIVGKPKTGFISAVGNFLISNNRSKQDKNYTPGVIYYEKEFNRPMIHVTIMSMLSGILSSMGITSRNLEKMELKAQALDSTAILKSEQDVIKQTEKIEIKKEKELEKEAKKNN